MGSNTDATRELQKRCWMAVEPEAYCSAARRQKQSQCQHEALSTSCAEEAASIKSDQTQIKQLSAQPRPPSHDTPTEAPVASKSSPQVLPDASVHASQGIKPVPQTSSNATEKPIGQPQEADPLLHPPAVASDSYSANCHAEHAEPASPLSHEETPVLLISNPTSHVTTASTDSTGLHASKPEQHKVEESQDAKQKRIAAYAANRQGAQLKAANSLPWDTALLATSPGTPPNEDAINVNTRQSSEACVPPDADARMSIRSGNILYCNSQGVKR